MTFATLRALHAIIGTAIDDIERVYRPSTYNPTHPPARPVPPAPSSPKPERPPRSPHRRTHLPSPPSYSPSPPPRPDSRSCSPSVSSQCSHTIDIASLPSPISVKFAAPPKPQPKQRARSQTLPVSLRPLSSKGDKKSATIDDIPPVPDIILDWPDLDKPFPRPSQPPANNGTTPTKVNVSEPQSAPQKWKSEQEEALTTNPEVINAVNRIVAACAHLSACVQRPFLTLCDATLGYHLPSCLRFLEASHTIEILREAGPKGMHVNTLAEKIRQRYAPGVVPKEVNPSTLSHILRLLATHHITREVRPDVFANNRLSSFMDSGKDVDELVIGPGAESKYEGTNGIAAFVGLSCDELFKASAYLTDCYLLPEPNGQLLSPISPTEASRSPIDDRRNDRDQHSTIRAHASRPSDASSILGGGVNVKVRTWEDDLQIHIDGPETPRTPRTSPGQQASSPSVASEASLTPPTFAPNLHAHHARKPSLTLATQSLLHPQPQNQHLSSPIALRKQSSRLDSPLVDTSRTPFPSPRVGAPYSLAASPAIQSSTQSLISHVSPSSHNSTTNVLLPPVSIPTHKPSLTSLNSPRRKTSLASLVGPTHKSSASSLASVASASPVHATQLSPVREKATPTKKKSQGFLRRIGSKAMLSPTFHYGSGNKVAMGGEGSAGVEGGYMRGEGVGEGVMGSHHPSLVSLRSPGSLFNLRRGHAHTSSTVSSNTNTSAGLISPHTDSPTSPFFDATIRNALPLHHSEAESQSQRTSPAPPVPPKPMHITPDHPMHAPFNLAFRTTQPYFEWLEREENGMRLKRFGKAMTGTSGWEVPGAILDALNWEDLPNRSVVVDVGGGIGSTSMLLANAFKHLRFVVQDRDPVVEMGLAMWNQRCPERLSSGQAAFQAHDFLTPQPALPVSLDLGSTEEGSTDEDAANLPQFPAVYLMRVVTHDWPDEFVTRILLHLRHAADPETKLLIADHLLPLACVDEDEDVDESNEKGAALPGTIRTLAPEGSPLLPNLGKANANAYWMDLTMRVTFNSQERTLRELAALTLTAGWKVVQVSRAEGSLFGHVVAVPVDIPLESLVLLKKAEEKAEAVAEAIRTDIQKPPFSPPMGDTFFSHVQLPSDEVIETQTRLFRFARRSRTAPNIPTIHQQHTHRSVWGAVVASATEGFGLTGKKGKGGTGTGVETGGKGRRQRSHTVGALDSPQKSKNEVVEAPPMPLPFLPPPSLPLQPQVQAEHSSSPQASRMGVAGSGDSSGTHDGGARNLKAWKTLKRMLSKPHLPVNGGGSPGSGSSGRESYGH